jgi:5'-methylthioinosine phosphorylase
MLAVIGGTGLENLDGFVLRETHAPDTPCGAASAPLLLGRVREREVVLLARHGRPHRIPPHRVNYRANISALRALGVDGILAVNAVGGIGASMHAGALAVPHDLIDYSWGRAHTFSDGAPGEPLLHVDFTEPFDGGLRRRLLAAAEAAGEAVVPFGVYGVAQGPRLETAAEIRRMARDGCDLVGMTAMPEAALAREAGIPYAMLCVVANPAAGLTAEPVTLEAMQAVLAGAMTRVQRVIGALLADAG